MKEYRLRQGGKEYHIRLFQASYPDGNFAIAMMVLDDDANCWIPWEVMTEDLEIPMEDRHAFVRTDKYLDFVMENGLGIVTENKTMKDLNTYVEVIFA